MTDYIDFEWFELDKKILRKSSRNGDDVGLRLTERVHNGAVVLEKPGKTYLANILPCAILQISADSAEELGKICYELGNRHLPIVITNGGAETPYDAPLCERLQSLGFNCSKRSGVFDGYSGGGHSHG